MTREDIYTAQEVADILGIAVATLYDKRWREQSGCPLFRQGKRLFAIKKDFDEWYQKRAVYV